VVTLIDEIQILLTVLVRFLCFGLHIFANL
jgi:hypothetical protein